VENKPIQAGGSGDISTDHVLRCVAVRGNVDGTAADPLPDMGKKTQGRPFPAARKLTAALGRPPSSGWAAEC